MLYQNLSELEKALLAIEALAQKIGQEGSEKKDQATINVAAALQLFMISAMSDDLRDFLNHIDEFRQKKIQENQQLLMDLIRESRTGKKVSDFEKITRINLTTHN
jgi:hypothetical protein